MPMWRCPHCGTPQAETARCWVCRRSSTACATCRHFRRSIAAQLGYCGLDRQRQPLRGDEIRGCWEAVIAPLEVVTTPIRRTPPAAPEIVVERTAVRKLEFVEVGTATASSAQTGRRTASTGSRRRSAAPDPGVVASAGQAAWPHDDDRATGDGPQPPDTNQRGSVEPRWSLWDDAGS
jgi:hypothetical protein